MLLNNFDAFIFHAKCNSIYNYYTTLREKIRSKKWQVFRTFDCCNKSPAAYCKVKTATN